MVKQTHAKIARLACTVTTPTCTKDAHLVHLGKSRTMLLDMDQRVPTVQRVRFQMQISMLARIVLQPTIPTLVNGSVSCAPREHMETRKGAQDRMGKQASA
jgi:hypothetical protein